MSQDQDFRKYVWTFCLMIFCLGVLEAQDPYDLLKEGRRLYEQREHERAVPFFEKANQIFKENSDSIGRLYVLHTYGSALIHQWKTNDCIPIYTEGRQLSKIMKHDSMLSLFNSSLSSLYYFKNEIDSVYMLEKENLSLKGINPNLHSDAYTQLASLKSHTSEYDSAKWYAMKAVEMDRLLNDSSSMPFACLSASIIHKDLYEYQKAVDILIEGKSYLRKGIDDHKKASIDRHLGAIFFLMGNLEKAKEETLNALQLCKDQKLQSRAISCYLQLANIAEVEDGWQIAIDYYELADSVNQYVKKKYYEGQIMHSRLLNKLLSGSSLSKTDEKLLSTVDQKSAFKSLVNKIKILPLFDYKRYPSEQLFEQAYSQVFNEVKANKYSFHKTHLLKARYRYYNQIGNHKKAFQALFDLRKLEKSISAKHQANIIYNMEAKYQKVEQDVEIASLEHQNTIKQERLAAQRQTISLISIALIIISVLSFFLFRMLTTIRKQSTELSKALDQKDLLLREIHHRVKNNLQLVSSLLKMQGRSIENESAQDAFRAGQARVRSMALIHQDLYNQEKLKDVNVRIYLKKLLNELFSTYKTDENKVKLDLAIDDINLDVDTLVPLGLILNEIITNSLKYAFPNGQTGKLKVAVQKNNHEVFIEIQDNGIGYDPSDVRKNSFGNTMVQALASQLNAKMDIEINGGVKTTIRFKPE